MSLDLMTELFPYNRLEIQWRCDRCGYDETNPELWKGALILMRVQPQKKGVPGLNVVADSVLPPQDPVACPIDEAGRWTDHRALDTFLHHEGYTRTDDWSMIGPEGEDHLCGLTAPIEPNEEGTPT